MFTFVNISQMPSYLSKSLFDDSLGNFNHLLVKIGLSPWNIYKHDISIAFSNEKKRKQYGTLTIEELKDIIRDIWGNHKEIEEILDKIDTHDAYRKCIQELIHNIYLIYPDRNCKNPEELYAFLEDVAFEISVLGEYFDNEKRIVLYTLNIEKAADDHSNPLPLEFEKVFIHELFHAYHYGDYIEELVERHDYTSLVVVESLASAFEWAYCEENKIAGSDDLQNSWFNYPIIRYPYSGAKRLLSDVTPLAGHHSLNNKKFSEVYNKSLTDMDGALRILLLSYDFYRIKNLIYSHKKEIVVKSKTCSTYTDFCIAMKEKKLGQIVKEEIPPIISKNPSLANDLLEEKYCRKNFSISASMLSDTQVFLPCGDRKYYANPMVNANGNMYYLYMHWRESHRKAVLNWIWTHR